jgi:hypothetical protein
VIKASRRMWLLLWPIWVWLISFNWLLSKRTWGRLWTFLMRMITVLTCLWRVQGRFWRIFPLISSSTSFLSLNLSTRFSLEWSCIRVTMNFCSRLWLFFRIWVPTRMCRITLFPITWYKDFLLWCNRLSSQWILPIYFRTCATTSRCDN